MELHVCPWEDCTSILSKALPTCQALHTLVLVGACPLQLNRLTEACSLECLALNFCAGLEAHHLPQLTSLR